MNLRLRILNMFANLKSELKGSPFLQIVNLTADQLLKYDCEYLHILYNHTLLTHHQQLAA